MFFLFMGANLGIISEPCKFYLKKVFVACHIFHILHSRGDRFELWQPHTPAPLSLVVAGTDLGMMAAMTQVPTAMPTAMSQNRSFCAHFALFVQFISCRIDNYQVFHSEADTFSL